MNVLAGLGALWALFVIAYFVGCLALGGWLASEKGYSVGSWIVLLLLFGVLALIVLVGAPDKKSRYNNLVQNNDPSAYDWVCKKCNNTNRKTALFCNSCGEKNNPI